MPTLHTTGRRGASAIAELVRKKKPDAQRTQFFYACHLFRMAKVKEIERQDPSSVRKDLDHDVVAQLYVCGHDGHGRIFGMGKLSKTYIQSSGGYRKKFLARDKEARRYEQRIKEMERDHKYSQSSWVPMMGQRLIEYSLQFGSWRSQNLANKIEYSCVYRRRQHTWPADSRKSHSMARVLHDVHVMVVCTFYFSKIME